MLYGVRNKINLRLEISAFQTILELKSGCPLYSNKVTIHWQKKTYSFNTQGINKKIKLTFLCDLFF